jgi:hypothetical protein
MLTDLMPQRKNTAMAFFTKSFAASCSKLNAGHVFIAAAKVLPHVYNGNEKCVKTFPVGQSKA